MTTPADPGAIDKRAKFEGEGKYESQWDAFDDGLTQGAEQINGLLAAVEALRARVDELLTKFDDCRAALARRVEQDTGLHAPPDSNTQEWHEWLIEQSDSGAEAEAARVAELELAASVKNARHGKALGDRAEAAEANLVEVAGALAHLIEFADQTGQGRAKQQEDARAALERAKAHEAAERALARLMSHFDPETGRICSSGLAAETEWEAARDALAKLDTLKA